MAHRAFAIADTSATLHLEMEDGCIHKVAGYDLSRLTAWPPPRKSV